MDRFKYRLWHKESKEYDEQYYMMVYGDGTVRCIEDSSWYMDYSDEYVIEQCTGLKDKNGKLIYEGDIVFSPLDGGTQKVVYWDNGLASFMAYNRYPDKHYTQRIGDRYFIELGFEVIGNIHENADLLGEE